MDGGAAAKAACSAAEECTHLVFFPNSNNQYAEQNWWLYDFRGAANLVSLTDDNGLSAMNEPECWVTRFPETAGWQVLSWWIATRRLRSSALHRAWKMLWTISRIIRCHIPC